MRKIDGAWPECDEERCTTPMECRLARAAEREWAS